MISETQDQLRRALATYKVESEQQLQLIMQAYEAEGFYCEHRPELGPMTILIWREQLIEMPKRIKTEKFTTNNWYLDDAFKNIVKGY